MITIIGNNMGTCLWPSVKWKKKEFKAELPYNYNYLKCLKHLSIYNNTITRKEKKNKI